MTLNRVRQSLLAVWIGLNVIDLILTLYALRIGALEGNPVVAGVYATGGDLALVAYKLFLGALIIGLVEYFRTKPMLVLLAVGTVLMACTVINNVAVIGAL